MSETIEHPIEMDRTLVGLDHAITNQDDHEIDLKMWVSRTDFAGLVIEVPNGADMVCLNLIGAMKLRDALGDAIQVMGKWDD